MATDGYVSRLNNVSYAALDERLLASVLMMPDTAAQPFSAKSGRRVNGAGLAVSVGGSPEAVTVTPGGGIIWVVGNAAAGPYAFAIPTAITMAALPARPSTGQSRIDLIVARVYDVDASAGPGTEIKIERVAGTASGSPAAPTLPALSLELARLTVPSTGTVTVTTNPARTVAAGGILPVATTAERDALPAYRGLVVDNLEAGVLQRYNGTTWKSLQESGGSTTPVLLTRAKTADQTGVPSNVPSGGWTVVTWPVADLSYGGTTLKFDAGNNEIYNDSAASVLVEVTASIGWAAASSGARWISLRKVVGATTTYLISDDILNSGTTLPTNRLHRKCLLEPGGRLAIVCAQNSGSTLAIAGSLTSGGGPPNAFEVLLLGPA